MVDKQEMERLKAQFQELMDLGAKHGYTAFVRLVPADGSPGETADLFAGDERRLAALLAEMDKILPRPE